MQGVKKNERKTGKDVAEIYNDGYPRHLAPRKGDGTERQKKKCSLEIGEAKGKTRGGEKMKRKAEGWREE